MAFRGEIVKMIESMVVSIEAHNFKITDTMKTHFVSFINEFFKHHVGTTDIDFKLTPNFLYAEADNIRVMIASDKNKQFEIPGYNIAMRDSIEAFILVGEAVGYDSVLMRCFMPPVHNSSTVNLPQYVDNEAPVKKTTSDTHGFVFQTPDPAPVAAPVVSAPVFAPVVSAPVFTPTVTAPSTTPAVPSFLQNTTTPSTSIFAAKQTTPPPPTNIFSTNPTAASVAKSPLSTFSGFNNTNGTTAFNSFSPKPMNTFSSFGRETNIFSRSDSTTSQS